MTTLAKTLLTVAISGLTLGSVVAWYGEKVHPVALTILLPLGAIAFGLFLIALTLEKEVAAYDQEQAKKGLAPQSDAIPALKKEENGPDSTAAQLKKKTV